MRSAKLQPLSAYPDIAVESTGGPERGGTRWHRSAAVVVVGLAVAAGLRLWLEIVGPLPGERASAAAFAPWDRLPEPVGDLATLMSVVGHPAPAILIVAASAWLVLRGCGRRDAAFVVLACTGVGANAVAKVVSGPTPLWSAEHGRFGLANYPSGHVVFATVLGGALAVLARRRGRSDLVGLALVVIATMGIMRVVSGAHLPSDVVAGYAFGAAWVAAASIVAGTARRT